MRSCCIKRYLSCFSCLALLLFLTLPFQAHSDQGKYWVPKDPPNSRYVIEAEIDVENDIVEGTEQITLANDLIKAIEVVALDWSLSDKYAVSVSVAEKTLTPMNSESGSPTNSPLLYKLPEPLLPGSKMQLDMTFRASISFKVNPIKYFPGNTAWYPRLWWDGLPTQDSFRVKLDVPEGYTVAASGLLNPETGYYEIDAAKTFGIYLGKDMLTESRDADGVLITALYTEKGAECAKKCLEIAVDSVKFYKEWLGFYPYKFLYIVPGNIAPWGGFPFATGIVSIHGQERFDTKPLRWWLGITAHEVGHEYWGEHVMDADKPDWLWIGMGIYADTQYMLRRQDIDRRPEWLGNYLRAVPLYHDTTIDIPPAQVGKIKFDHNNTIVHSKVVGVIYALESVLGEETFMRVYKRCLREYGGRRFGYRDLWRVCEEESGEDLSWFFEQWVRSNKYLCYQIESQESAPKGDKFISTVQVRCTGTLKMPVPVKAVFEDGTEQVLFTDRNLEVSLLRFDSASKWKEVIINPEKNLPMLDKPPTEIPREVEEMLVYGWPIEKDKILAIYNGLKGKDITNDIFWYRLGRSLFDNKYYSESAPCFRDAAEQFIDKTYKFASLVWAGVVSDLLGEREEAVKYYQESLNHVPEQEWSYDQFGITMSKEWVEERLSTPFTMKEK
jgi:hypothetical protein